MGIRPENIHDEDVFVQTASSAVINAKVEVTELMGSETYLYLSTSGKDENIIARVNPRTTSRAGQDVQVAFDVNHLQFFDTETEVTLLSRLGLLKIESSPPGEIPAVFLCSFLKKAALLIGRTKNEDQWLTIRHRNDKIILRLNETNHNVFLTERMEAEQWHSAF